MPPPPVGSKMIVDGQVVLVSDQDADSPLLARLRINHKGYVETACGRLLHRVLLGVTEPEVLVDHINHIKTDNRRCNLRKCFVGENNKNKGKTKTNTSGFKGASYDKAKKKWRASIQYDGKSRHLGYFSTAEDAHKAYCKAATAYHGEFACFG